MNIIVVFLIGLAATLFLFGALDSFNLSKNFQTILIVIISIVYLIVLIAFLWPKETTTPVEIEPTIIEKEIIKEIEKPVIKYITRNKTKHKEQQIKSVEAPTVKVIRKKAKNEKKPPQIRIIEVEKKQEKKSKFVGSSYNERYHLRTCRFAGSIKPKYLIEEDKERFFKLRGFAACKVCQPDKK